MMGSDVPSGRPIFHDAAVAAALASAYSAACGETPYEGTDAYDRFVRVVSDFVATPPGGERLFVLRARRYADRFSDFLKADHAPLGSPVASWNAARPLIIGNRSADITDGVVSYVRATVNDFVEHLQRRDFADGGNAQVSLVRVVAIANATLQRLRQEGDSSPLVPNGISIFSTVTRGIAAYIFLPHEDDEPVSHRQRFVGEYFSFIWYAACLAERVGDLEKADDIAKTILSETSRFQTLPEITRVAHERRAVLRHQLLAALMRARLSSERVVGTYGDIEYTGGNDWFWSETQRHCDDLAREIDHLQHPAIADVAQALFFMAAREEHARSFAAALLLWDRLTGWEERNFSPGSISPLAVAEHHLRAASLIPPGPRPSHHVLPAAAHYDLAQRMLNRWNRPGRILPPREPLTPTYLTWILESIEHARLHIEVMRANGQQALLPRGSAWNVQRGWLHNLVKEGGYRFGQQVERLREGYERRGHDHAGAVAVFERNYADARQLGNALRRAYDLLVVVTNDAFQPDDPVEYRQDSESTTQLLGRLGEMQVDLQRGDGRSTGGGAGGAMRGISGNAPVARALPPPAVLAPMGGMVFVAGPMGLPTIGGLPHL